MRIADWIAIRSASLVIISDNAPVSQFIRATARAVGHRFEPCGATIQSQVPSPHPHPFRLHSALKCLVPGLMTVGTFATREQRMSDELDPKARKRILAHQPESHRSVDGEEERLKTSTSRQRRDDRVVRPMRQNDDQDYAM